jgi:cell wall-associated NlpC family hydrolase
MNSTDELNRKELREHAEARRARLFMLVGTPYHRGGMDPVQGFDCFTLLEYVRREFYGRDTPTAGIPAADLTSAQAAALGIYRALGGHEHTPGPWVSCDPVDGCAVALGRTRHGRLHHCGVLVENQVMHAMESVGVALSPIERIFYLYARVEFFECRT